MSDGEYTSPVEGPDWESARTIWFAGGVDLPKQINSDNAHYLTDLRRAAANFVSAKFVTELDRKRDWSFEKLADHCRGLSDDLSKIDDVAFSRIAGASPVSLTPLLGETTANLDLLESAFRHALVPIVPHKKPQEHNNFLVVVLANIYERNTDHKASVTTNPVTDEREGLFVNFVMSYTKHFFPDLMPSSDKKKDKKGKLNPRFIQQALKARRDNPERESET